MVNFVSNEYEIIRKLKEFSKIYSDSKYDLFLFSQNNLVERFKSLDLRIFRFFQEINTNFDYLKVFDFKLKRRKTRSFFDYCNLKSNSLLNIINDIETYGIKKDPFLTKLLKLKGKHTINLGIYKFEREL